MSISCWFIVNGVSTQKLKAIAEQLRGRPRPDGLILLDLLLLTKKPEKSIQTINILEFSFRPMRRTVHWRHLHHPTSAERIYHSVFGVTNNSWKNHQAARKP